MAAQGEHTDHLPQDVFEEGNIYFYYKPKVGMDQVGSLDDVQRFHILLQPGARNAAAIAATEPKDSTEEAEGEEGGQEQKGNDGQAAGAPQAQAPSKCRLIAVPKKALPDTAKPGREKFYGFVEAVAGTPQELTEGLEGGEYETKTCGTRHQGAARCVGEGTYVIAKHKRGTNLGYKLSVPEELGEAQRLFRVYKAGDFVFSIKNPTNRPPGAPNAGPEPEYSEPQAKRLKGASWIGVEDPSMLDVVGADVLLVGAKQGDVEAHLGEAGEELASISESDSEKLHEGGGGEADVAQQLEQRTTKATGGTKSAVADVEGKSDTAGGDQKEGEPIVMQPAVEGKLV